MARSEKDRKTPERGHPAWQEEEENALERLDNEGGPNSSVAWPGHERTESARSSKRNEHRPTSDVADAPPEHPEVEAERPPVGGYGYGVGYGYDRDNMMGGEYGGYGESGSKPVPGDKTRTRDVRTPKKRPLPRKPSR